MSTQTIRPDTSTPVAPSELDLQLAMQAARLGVWQLDLTTGDIQCSAQCKANFGLPADAVVTERRLFEELIHPEDRAETRQRVQRAIKAHDVYVAEYRCILPDGQARWIWARGQATYDRGLPVTMVGVTLDISDRKRADRERDAALISERIARAQAERAARVTDDFVATLSHELRTPLNAILGWTQLLRHKPVGDRLAQIADVLDRNARAQMRLINDLLDTSSIIAGKISLDLAREDLAAVVAASVADAQPAALARNVAIVQAIAEPLAVRGDRDRLRQVVWNLLSNAVKFTPPGGKVMVITRRFGDAAELIVRDTGPGIPEHVLPHIFDRFRQADSSTTRKHGGLGIGLWLVKTLTEMHGGEVVARTTGSGGGAEFLVRLPLMTTEAAAVMPTAVVASESPLQGLRIMVVDDDRDTLLMMCRLLEQHGAHTTCSGSVAEAEQKLHAAAAVDLVLCDLSMPDRDGFSLIDMVRSAPGTLSRVPVAAVSALSRSQDRDRALAHGFDAFLAKPFTADQLVGMVLGLVRRNAHAAATSTQDRLPS